MLRLNNVEVIYDDVILVLKGLSLEVPDGKIITLLGANGAGKSTTLKAISGLLMPEKGKVTQGSIEFDGVRIDGRYPEDVCKLGIFQRSRFPWLARAMSSPRMDSSISPRKAANCCLFISARC